MTDQDQNAQAGTSIPGRFGLGQFQTEPESYFYDLNAKLTYRLPNDDKFSLSIYDGVDELDNSRNVDGNANLDRLCDFLQGEVLLEVSTVNKKSVSLQTQLILVNGVIQV